MAKLTAIIYDLDNTLRDTTHRVKYLQTNPPQWREFFMACGDDLPIQPMINQLKKDSAAGHVILMLSGAADYSADITRNWLANYDVPPDKLMMRPDGDFRPDHELKREWVLELLRDYEIIRAYDDMEHNLTMFEELGINAKLPLSSLNTPT